MDKGLDLKKKKRQKESGPERPKARVYPGDGHSLNMQDGVMGDKEGEAGAGRGGARAADKQPMHWCWARQGGDEGHRHCVRPIRTRVGGAGYKEAVCARIPVAEGGGAGLPTGRGALATRWARRVPGGPGPCSQPGA